MKLTWKRRIGVYAGAGTLSLAVISAGGGGTAYAIQNISKVFPQVTCSAKTPIGTLSQKQDITVGFSVPDTVTPGEEFTMTFPGGSTDLPTTGAGIKINSFQNLSTTYQVNNATFVAGSIQTSGPPLIDADFAGPNPAVPIAGGGTAEFPTANTFKSGVPGPFPPGTLTTPTVTLKVKAPASGNVTFQAVTLTTTTNLNSPAVTSAVVTCNIPTDVLATVPVVAGGTTTVPTTAPPTTAPPTTVPGTTTPTTAPPTTVPGTTTPTTAPATTVPTTTPPTTTPPTTGTTVPPTTTPPTTAAPTTTTAAPTTTTTIGEQGPTTTTTVPAEQSNLPINYKNTNDCTSTVTTAAGVPLLDPSEGTMGVTFTANAFPEPHQGDPIKLTNTKLTIAVPADLLQTGIDAGLIKAGDQVPSTLTFVIAASDASPASKTYTVSSTATVEVDGNGNAKPLTATVNLPDATFTPNDAETAVVFTQSSMKVVSTLHTEGLGDLKATFECTPSGNNTVAVLHAFAGQVVTTTTLGPSGGTVAPGGTTGTTTAPVSNGGSLPRTGANAALWLVLGAILLDLGLVALVGTRRRTRSYFQR